jgi:hypothetical protein
VPKRFLEPIVGSEVTDDITNKENIDVRVQQWQYSSSQPTFVPNDSSDQSDNTFAIGFRCEVTK